MFSTDVADSTNVLRFLYKASKRSLFCICSATALFTVNEQKREAQVKLRQAVNHEDIIGNKVFRINPDFVALVDLDKKQFAGITAEHKHIFISLPQRNCVMVCNGKLQYPDGGNIDDLKALADQNFYPVITNSHFPRNLNNAAALTKKQHNKFVFYAEPKKSQEPQTASPVSQDQSVFKSTP
jgi:hypothetical protein